MKKSITTPELRIETDISGFAPSQTQIETFARRLMPEIKKYFADEQIQKEFVKWQEQNVAKEDK